MKSPLPSIQASIQQVGRYQDAGDWGAAVDLLAEQLPVLCESLPHSTLATLLAPFPSSFLESSPSAWLVAGIVQATIGDDASAVAWLLRIESSVPPLAHPEHAAWVWLELARISCRHTAYQDVQSYLSRADALLAQTTPRLFHLLPFASYLRACLYAGTGRVVEGIPLAQAAASRFRELGYVRREFDCWLALVSLTRQLGDELAVAESLNGVHSCFGSGVLGPSEYVSILNAETQCAWYGGDLAGALAKAQSWVTLTQSNDYLHQRVHAQLAMGNLQRARGDYAEAQQRYGVVRVLATQLQPKFIWEVDAHEAWLAVLQGRLDAAATRVACALSAATPEQPMYLQVTLAVIQLLEGQLAAAQDRLQASLAYYQRSQERTATCAIAFLLAWIHLQLNPSTRALPKELRSELDWLAGRPRAYFPHWWHPALISQVALWLLGRAEHRAIGQRLFREGFLGTEGVKALLAAAAKRDFRLRDEAVNLLAQLGAVDLHLAEIFRNDLARQVVAGAIQSGQVRAAMVPDLLFELRTAQSHNRNNEIAVAIFLLHLQKRPTHEIAALLDRSYSTVSHTLRGLYEHLGVSETGGRRPNRRDKLYQVAREKGLLC